MSVDPSGSSLSVEPADPFVERATDATGGAGEVRPEAGPRHNPTDVRLLCFPHAGAGASAYRDWGRLLPGVDVVAVQLPGRESQLAQPPIPTATE